MNTGHAHCPSGFRWLSALYKSQNAFEHGLLAWLKASLPEGIEAILVLDRGFKRVDLVSRLSGFGHVIRTGGNVHVESSAYTGRVDGLVRRRGIERDIRDATLRPSRPVPVRLVAIWSGKSKEPWLLMTNLDAPARTVVALYAKRFRIEEMFRDQKDWRYGLQAGHTLVRSAEQLERLLLVAALVQFFALLIGAAARKLGLDRGFRANTVKNRATHTSFGFGDSTPMPPRLKLPRACLPLSATLLSDVPDTERHVAIQRIIAEVEDSALCVRGLQGNLPGVCGRLSRSLEWLSFRCPAARVG